MRAISRRQLAIYSIEQLMAGTKPAAVAKSLSAELYFSKRTRQAQMLIDDIYSELEKRRLLCVAKVSTAKPLSKTTHDSLMRLIKELSGAESVEIDAKTDSSIIGGATVKTANLKWDASLKTRLEAFASGRLANEGEKNG